MNVTGLWAKYGNELAEDPLLVLALTAALVALATTPIAFAVLGRLDWFKARRGRVMQRPDVLVDRGRDDAGHGHPGHLLGPGGQEPVLRQEPLRVRPQQDLVGARAGPRLQEPARRPTRRSSARWSGWPRSGRTWSTTSRSSTRRCSPCGPSPGPRPPWPRRSPTSCSGWPGSARASGVDGPQQLMDFTAPPVELAGRRGDRRPATAVAASPRPRPRRPRRPRAGRRRPAAGRGRGRARRRARAPEGARRDAPAGRPAAGLDRRASRASSYIETFNADNLFEKIDGRAESFIQYDVKGMAYTFYHPTGDESNEVQLYIFEMGDPLKALGKYGSEKPDEAKPIAVGTEGYTVGRQHALLRRARTTPRSSRPRTTPSSPPSPSSWPSGSPPSRSRASARPPRPRPRTPAGTAGRASRRQARRGDHPETSSLLPAGGRAGRRQVRRPGRLRLQLPVRRLHGRLQGGRRHLAGLPPPLPRRRRRPRRSSRSTSTRSSRTGPRSRRSRPRGPTGWSSARTSACSTSSSCKGNTLAAPTAPPTPKPAEAFARAFAKSLPANVPVDRQRETMKPSRRHRTTRGTPTIDSAIDSALRRHSGDLRGHCPPTEVRR